MSDPYARKVYLQPLPGSPPARFVEKGQSTIAIMAGLEFLYWGSERDPDSVLQTASAEQR